ncbi:MAG: ABC transporter permease subunit [Pseudomonadota bacterium]
MNASLLFPRRLSLQVALDIICTLPLVLPPTVTGYCLILLFGRNGVVGQYLYALTGWSIMFTWYAAVLASFVVAFPLMVKTTQAAIESVDKNLISASYSLGHGDGEPFFNHKKGGQIHDPGLFYLMSEAIDNQ